MQECGPEGQKSNIAFIRIAECVSPETVKDLFVHNPLVEHDKAQDQNRLFAYVSARNPEIVRCHAKFAGHWKLNPDDRNDFRSGYMIGYMLLDTQAGFRPGHTIPSGEIDLATAYFGRLHKANISRQDFLAFNTRLVERHDKNYIVATQAYSRRLAVNEELEENGAEALMLGALAVYDLLRFQQQRKVMREISRLIKGR